MDFKLVFKELLKRFQDQDIVYALIGGFALHLAGFTRATQDVDFLVHEKDIQKIKEIMEKLGYDLIHESEHVSNYWHPTAPLGGIDYLHARRNYSQAMLQRAKKFKIFDQMEIPVVIPEDLIGLKVQASSNDPQRRSYDMADIEHILKQNSEQMNLDLIREYFKLFDRSDELEQLMRKIQNVK